MADAEQMRETASPAPRTIEELTTPSWGWYYGDGEFFREADSREDALGHACAEGLSHIALAAHAAFRLSAEFDADWFFNEIMNGSDRVGEDDEFLFDFTDEQLADLNATVRAAIDAWQVRHRLAPVPSQFVECEKEAVPWEMWLPEHQLRRHVSVARRCYRDAVRAGLLSGGDVHG